MLNWANQFNIFCLLQNNAPSTIATKHRCILAVAYNADSAITNFSSLSQLKHNEWYFGHIAYTATAFTEKIKIKKDSPHQFGDVLLFVPDIIITLHLNSITIKSNENNTAAIFQDILNSPAQPTFTSHPIQLQARLDKNTYVEKIKQIQTHLQKGNCYELNFCMEFYSNNTKINPIQEYLELCHISPTPFSTLYKVNSQYLICASPERYLQKINKTIISQPIKGTIKRDITNDENDAKLKQQLQNSKKEISENVMVVDLVRNDLSKICKAASVHVSELMKVYTFPQLHHLISTVQGQLKEDISFKEILEATFPMGSMTGAPKHRVVQLIDEYEQGSRGIFSGTVGYISPDNHFDFNVVIRSILYNAANKYLSYWVGSGITIYSNPAEEYDECLLKAKAIQITLG